MKATHKLFAGLAVASVAASVAMAARPLPRKVGPESDYRAGSVAAAAAALNYSTGFEAPLFAPGWIGAGTMPAGCGGLANPCWGVSGASTSVAEGHIDTIHPATGTQHLRIAYDPAVAPATSFGRATYARYPRNTEVAVRPTAANTMSCDVAITSLFGQDFRIQPQSSSEGFLNSSILFFYTGTIYLLDEPCGSGALNFLPTGAFWDSTGAYQTYTVQMNPCGLPSGGQAANSMRYFYGGSELLADANQACTAAGAPAACCTGPAAGTCTGGCVYAGTRLEQFLVFGDNYPGSDIDIDNVVLSSLETCPNICGNGILESPPEQCEPGVVACNPGHTCGAVGSATECQCDRVCTLNAPCTLNNGANGPFYGPFDAAYGGIFIYQAPAGVDAVSVELCGSTGADQRIFYWGSCSDPADPGSANDDCYPGYSGADPTASCYGTVTAPNYESCTCHDNPLPGDNCYLLQIRPPSGTGSARIEVNKKAVCFDTNGHLGACCDTNGADVGCTDNVLQGACTGADKVWTENGKCATTQCACIPDCTGATCGDDGCGGSCGTCDDGDVCNGLETCNANRTCDAGTPLVCNDGNACNGVETCNATSGCVPGMPLNCNDGVACNGVETCVAPNGCVAGTPVNCDDGVNCTVDACNEPDGTCTHDDADCAIPTVSEWGLVVLALMLLIGAKVYFGRRQAIA